MDPFPQNFNILVIQNQQFYAHFAGSAICTFLEILLTKSEETHTRPVAGEQT